MDSYEQIKEYGFSFFHDKSGVKICYLQIIGEIEGHVVTNSGYKSTCYEHLFPILTMVETDPDISGLFILIHTTGGDVDAGLALAECISTITKPVVSLTIGTCHSIGIPIAISADISYIAPSGLMLAHPVRFTGTMIGSEISYEYIDKLQNRVTEYIVKNSLIRKNDYKRIINNKKELTQDVGSMLDAATCVNLGLINKIGGLNTAINKLFELIINKSIN
ncbi:MAG: ATP-dependent Clp protease proteolytic subunit [Clostridiales bacterium]|nr:ATP-dependent Clp protease proteolytic subunit [Clostridiales bacterium]